jgi:outer membrane protein TolC
MFLFSISIQYCIGQTASGTTTTGPSTTLPAVDSIEEKLVELALKGPEVLQGEHRNKIDEYQLKGAKNNWLNILSVSANYNDQSFKKSVDPTSTYVYPKFFTGITIPLGVLFSRTGVKAAKEQVEISKNIQDQLARNIRAEVLSRYKEYKNLSKLIINQQGVVDDYEAAFTQAKKKFSEGTITIEVHNLASKNYNDEMAKLLNLQLQQDLVKIQIEKMIGTNLDSVIHQ